MQYCNTIKPQNDKTYLNLQIYWFLWSVDGPMFVGSSLQKTLLWC